MSKENNDFVRYTDVFERKTVYVEDRLLEQIQNISMNRKGEQTRIINAAIRYYLNGHGTEYTLPDKKFLVRKTVYIEKILVKEVVAAAGGGRRGGQQQFIHNALSSYLDNPENVAKHTSNEDWWRNDFWKDIKIHIDE
jgi:hypothetical protein